MSRSLRRGLLFWLESLLMLFIVVVCALSPLISKTFPVSLSIILYFSVLLTLPAGLLGSGLSMTPPPRSVSSLTFFIELPMTSSRERREGLDVPSANSEVTDSTSESSEPEFVGVGAGGGRGESVSRSGSWGGRGREGEGFFSKRRF